MGIIVTKPATNLYQIASDTRTISVTTDELDALNSFALHERLRSDITYVVNRMIEDGDLVMSDYPYSKDELIDEIYVDYADRIDNDEIPLPDDDDISESVGDLVNFYVMNS